MTTLRTLSTVTMAFATALLIKPMVSQNPPQIAHTASEATGAKAANPRPVLPLYRHFFLHVAHLERDKALATCESRSERRGD